jgi:DNA-binding GntR family transcriptional regulator
MELIDRQDHQKLYLQLYEILRKKIESNEWPVGSRIPTEDELCKMFNISRATVRTAILEFVRQGYLVRQQGKGTFVSRNVISEGLSMAANLRELPFEEDLSFTINILARTVMKPTGDLRAKLAISKDIHVIYIKRLNLIDNEAVVLQETYIPHHVCPSLLEDDTEHNFLFDLFEKKYGIKITKVKNYMEITSLNSNEARLIGSPEGSSAVLLTQYFYSGETPIMYARLVNRSEKFKFLIELERKLV